MSITQEVTEKDLQEGVRAFKEIIPFLVRATVTTSHIQKQIHALRNALCPNEGPLHDARLGDWKDWAERSSTE